MSIWILAPDQKGVCCACGVRTNPCDSCSAGCTPIAVTEQQINQGGFVVNSNPTGIVFKFGGGGASIAFTNGNSKMQTISNSNDSYQVQGVRFDPINPSFPDIGGFPNGVVNYTFEYELLINSGEIVTLYSETLGAQNIPESQYYPTNADGPILPMWPAAFYVPSTESIDETPVFCNGMRNTPGSITFSSGNGDGSSSNGSILLVVNNDSGFTEFTANNAGLTTAAFSGPGSSNPSPYQSSLTFGETSSFQINGNCPPFSCNFSSSSYNATPGGGVNYQTCFNSASYGIIINPNVLYGNVEIETFVSSESYFFTNSLGGCSFNGNPSVSCGQVPGALNQSVTFQVGPIRTIPNVGTGQLFPTSMCVIITSANNGYIQLQTSGGAPVDLTTRIGKLNIITNGLP